MKWKFTILPAATAVACLLSATPALAVVSETNVHVTSPSGFYLIADEVTSTDTMTLTGTSNGIVGEKLDINCYAGNRVLVLAKEVTIQSGGTFSFSGLFTKIDATCVLRAVPTKDTNPHPPGSPSPFTGPTLAIGDRENNAVNKGPNAGKLKAYYIYASQTLGAFDYSSLGDCTVDDSYVYDPVTFASAVLDYCNAWFNSRNGAKEPEPGIANPTRSELQVDGANAYVAGNAQSAVGGAEEHLGYPSLTYGYSIDPATGNLALEETDGVVKCAPEPAVYPPTSTSCSSFAPTGVQVKMLIAQGHNGRVASVTQFFSSTDGLPHATDLLENNDFRAEKNDGEFNFPWTGEGLKGYTAPGQTLPGAPSAPGSFFVKGSAAEPDGGEQSPQGAVTFSNAPEGVTIIGSTANKSSWIELHYRRTVPASGSVVLGFTYSNAFLQSEVQTGAAAAQASYTPSVAIASPANATTSAQNSLTVSGTASDANGPVTVQVNGHSAPVAANGAWSVAVPLTAGANTLTAIATNIFGDTAQAQINVTQLAPVVSNARQSASKWREGGALAKASRHARKRRPPVGTTFSYTLNEAATVHFAFTQPARGRKVGKQCVAPAKRYRHRHKCTRTVTIATLAFAGHTGKNAVRFQGRVSRSKRLRPGRYTVVITAKNTAGQVSAPKKLTFTIVR